jgi:peptidoglycan/LPS O-acetylase OafA/YrhL
MNLNADISFDSLPHSDATTAVAPARSVSAAPGRVIAIDAIKGVASQLILLHHFCIYGSMADAIWNFAPPVFKWLANDARMAVQCFLVMAGFLAAGAMLPNKNKAWTMPKISGLPSVIWQRYHRLAKTFFVGLLAAIACAAVARALVNDPSTPALPDLNVLVAHIFFAQDLFGIPALTAGAWYIGIDMQLYILLALICAASALFVRRATAAKYVAMALMMTLGACSLFIFNRNANLEIFGIYFFGSYTLGATARWASQSAGSRKWMWVMGIAIVCALALLVQWRTRIAISTATALYLAIRGAHRSVVHPQFAQLASFLSRISFPLFVLHYPVLMLVNALVNSAWGDDVVPNALGFVMAWALSMLAANKLANWVEGKPARDTLSINPAQ